MMSIIFVLWVGILCLPFLRMRDLHLGEYKTLVAGYMLVVMVVGSFLVLQVDFGVPIIRGCGYITYN